MKKILLGLALAASTVAQAQTSTAPQSTEPAAAATTSAPPVSPTQTMTASVKTEESTLRKKIAATAYFNLMVDAVPVNAGADSRHDEADYYSENFLQLAYKLSETQKIAFRHNFAWHMAGPKNGEYQLIDPGVIYSVTGPKLGGFEPLTTAFTYYAPVSEASRADHRLGVLRLDMSADYNVTPKLTASLFTSPRLSINTSANETPADKNGVGSDSKLRFLAGGSTTYNFSDKLNVYYSPYIDFGTSQHNRGRIEANLASGVTAMQAKGERWNQMVHEVGVGFSPVKEFNITPAVINYVSMNDGQGFAREEMLEYDVYVTASF